jgi:hypothetical protein
MTHTRKEATTLNAAELAAFLDTVAREHRGIVLKLRRVVRHCAPGAAEATRFHSLCYFRPSRPFGAIGGNICMIEADGRGVRLSFIHGASLPDPCTLLRGKAKAKRFVPIRSAGDSRREEVRDLIRAAAGDGQEAPRRDRLIEQTEGAG